MRQAAGPSPARRPDRVAGPETRWVERMGNRSVEEERRLYEQIVRCLGDAILVADRDGRVVFANPAARTLLGRDAEGQDLDKLLGSISAALASVAGSPQPRPWAEVPVVIRGESRILAARWVPLSGEAARGGAVLWLTDVTETRDAEARARRDTALVGLGRLTHHVAHELKNPIGALKLYALLLERQFRAGKPDGRELIEKIGRSIEHLVSLVAGITDFGLPASLEHAPLDPGRLLDECAKAVEERTESQNIRVVRHYEPGVSVPADARALRPAVAAIVENALDAMPSGGTLTLASARAGARGPHQVELVVRDTGTGMSEEAQARLYEPFFTTKADGTGLGMTIASHVVGQHGGRIEVRSRPGDGTAVSVILPAS